MVRFSEIVTPQFYSVLPRLSLLVGYTAILMLVLTELANLSLGLVAFTWLMWVTLPWAFGERLDYFELKKKIEASGFSSGRLITPLDVKKAEHWLTSAQDEFLGAGAIFLIAGMLDLASPSLTGPTAVIQLQYPFSFQFLETIAFLGALFTLGVAVFRAQQVIKFIGSPNQIDFISRFGSFYAIDFAKGVGFSIALFTGILDFGVFVLFLPAWFTPLSDATFAVQVLDALFLLGGFGTIPTFAVRTRTASRKDTLGPLLVMLPWAGVIVFLFAVRFL